MERVVKPLTIIPKRFILDVTAALDRLWKIWNVQYKFTEFLHIFAEKVTTELDLVKLDFSYFFYNNLQNINNILILFLSVCYHQLCSHETGKKKSINFIITFAHFSLKKE